MRAKITKRLVDSVVPGASNMLVWDTEIPGFLLVVSRGGAKSYAVEYRVGEGRGSPKRRFTIGRHGAPWTPDGARAEARKILGRVAAGEDPQAERGAQRMAESVSELIDLYLAEGCAHKKPRTLAADRGRFEHHIRPAIGRKKVRDLTRGDIQKLMTDVIAGRTVQANTEPRRAGSVPKGGPGVGAQVVTLMGTILTFAVDRGIRADNPALGIDKPKVRKLERFLQADEIGRLGKALAEAEALSGNPGPTSAIRLLLLTGARRSEILGLQWSWVDFERGALFLPDSKTGRKTVHLSAPAAAVLASLPKIEGNPFVFAGEAEGKPYAGLDKVWFKIRKTAGLEDVRLHDLRHSAASIAASRGVSLLLIGKVLGHRQVTTTERYSHLTDDPVKATAELIGTHVADALGLTEAKPAAEIVRLPRRPG